MSFVVFQCTKSLHVLLDLYTNISFCLCLLAGSHGTVVKNLPTRVGGTRDVVWSPGQEDSLEYEMATCSWQSAPVYMPGKFHGQRTLAGYSPWTQRVTIIPIGKEKNFNKMQHSIMIQILDQLEIESNIFNLIRKSYKKKTVLLTSYLWKNECFPSKIRTKTGISTLLIPSQHGTEIQLVQ